VPRTSIFVIAAAAAATCALSACGSVRMGAAAISGGERIKTTTLSDQVSKLEHAAQVGKGTIQLQFPQAQAPQEVLSWLLRFQIRDELAVRNHLVVTTGESQQALSKLAQSTGRTGPAFVQLAVANGLAPDMLPDLGRYEAIQNDMFTRLNGGTMPRTQARIQALSPQFARRECVAAKSLNIQVNPQFGQLDYSTYSVIPANSPLSEPTAPAPSPTAKPQLTPAC
jgi:outer membrane murein-binding lipoprotein Lpp